MNKLKPLLIGLGLQIATTLITFLICVLGLDSYYFWGVYQMIITVGFFCLGWFSSGLINRHIRKQAHNRLEDTSFKNPKKAEYKTFITSCYYACLFGLIINLIGFYTLGMGKFNPDDLTFLFLIK